MRTTESAAMGASNMIVQYYETDRSGWRQSRALHQEVSDFEVERSKGVTVKGKEEGRGGCQRLTHKNIFFRSFQKGFGSASLCYFVTVSVSKSVAGIKTVVAWAGLTKTRCAIRNSRLQFPGFLRFSTIPGIQLICCSSGPISLSSPSGFQLICMFGFENFCREDL